MTDSYDLTQLGADAFEHLANFLAMKTLGAGVTGFGPGADGGRDGYFEGEAAYPSSSERWRGVWYIQSKFHKPHLTKNAQTWLVERVKEEISEFDRSGSARHWPDNWIICTNIDPSGKPETGSFDAINRILRKHPKGARTKFAIWGGRKILDLLASHDDVRRSYMHLLTPGHVLSALYDNLEANAELRPKLTELVRYFVVAQFNDQMYTKLDRAGSALEARPTVQDLFIDLPFAASGRRFNGILRHLCVASSQLLRYSHRSQIPDAWRLWSRNSRRARVVLIKGGPGQGKSTIGQYLSQIHRAALILDTEGPKVSDSVKAFANSIRHMAERDGFWPRNARIPVQIELKEYAHWHSIKEAGDSKSVLAYLSAIISKNIGERIGHTLVKRTLEKQSWIFVFDGLDEVPNDHKDQISKEVIQFLDDVLIEIDADVLAICTSRPQGYSGQFSDIDGPQIDLSRLDVDTAMRCAEPLLRFGQNSVEAEASVSILESSIRTPSIQELMTTPLQSHIMAMVIRDGGHPPEKRWSLFQSFYQIMRRREMLKDFKDLRVAKLLREEERLLKAVHMRLGFVLHAKAENSAGAQTVLSKLEFRDLVRDVVTYLGQEDVEGTVDVVMEATTERLVLVSTPDNGDQVRFDIRQLQEYFAAEYLYDGLIPAEVGERIKNIGVDAHWREVMHFLMSALIADRRVAEFAVAVQELRKLNEGDSSTGNTIYARRGAAAALLSTRLLYEGVLEEDQNDRKNMKQLFDALAGVVIQPVLKEFAKIRAPKSRKWVVSQLIERTKILQSTECAAALYTLGHFLDENISSRDLCAVFLSCPQNIQEYIILSWKPIVSWEDGDGLPQRTYMENELNVWVFLVAISIINSSGWSLYSSDVIEILLDICRVDFLLFESAAELYGMDSETIEDIRAILDFDTEMDFSREDFRVDCGFVSAEVFDENWLSGEKVVALAKINAERHVDNTDGLVRLMFLCLKYSFDASIEVLNDFYSLAQSIPAEKINKIPDYLLALIPIENWQSRDPCNLNMLAQSKKFPDIHSFKAMAAESILPPYNGTIVYDGATASAPDKLLVKLPNLAVDLCFGQGSINDLVPDFLITEKYANLMLGRPEYSAQYILSMGRIFSKNPELFKELKMKFSSLTDTEILKIKYFSKNISPFTLDLAADASLLRVLSLALCSWWDNFSHNKSDLPDQFQNIYPLKTVVSAFGLSFSILREFLKSSARSSERASALALSWLLWEEMDVENKIAADVDIDQELGLFEELRTADNAFWLTKAAIKLLSPFHEFHPPALRFCTFILLQENDGRTLRKVANLVVHWGEKSAAPVTSKKLLSAWLGLTSKISTYAQ